MSTNGCCRGLPANVCIARPYGCSDGPVTKSHDPQGVISEGADKAPNSVMPGRRPRDPAHSSTEHNPIENIEGRQS